MGIWDKFIQVSLGGNRARKSSLGKRGEHLCPKPHRVPWMSVWSLLTERSIPMPLGLLALPDVHQSSTGALAWPVAQGLHSQYLFQLVLVLLPISVNYAGATVSVNSLILFPQCGLGKCCLSHFSCLINLIPAFFFQGWWQAPKLACFVLVKTSQGCLILTPKVICLKGFFHQYVIVSLTEFSVAIPQLLSLFLVP